MVFESSLSLELKPINAYTMGGIVRDSGLTTVEFKKLL